jgi:hypothetical protein
VDERVVGVAGVEQVHDVLVVADLEPGRVAEPRGHAAGEATPAGFLDDEREHADGVDVVGLGDVPGEGGDGFGQELGRAEPLEVAHDDRARRGGRGEDRHGL